MFYLDAKGDQGTAARFIAAMEAAGASDVALFPSQPFDGWRGSATEIFNRLMSVESFSEPYYRAMTKLMLSLACQAPQGPPRRSDELLRRLKLAELADCYKGHPQVDDVLRIPEKEANGTYGRYRALFSALHGVLDGQWAWEDVQAGYVLLDGLALKEEARGLGRYLLEDFGQAMVKRLAPSGHARRLPHQRRRHAAPRAAHYGAHHGAGEPARRRGAERSPRPCAAAPCRRLRAAGNGRLPAAVRGAPSTCSCSPSNSPCSKCASRCTR